MLSTDIHTLADQIEGRRVAQDPLTDADLLAIEAVLRGLVDQARGLEGQVVAHEGRWSEGTDGKIAQLNRIVRAARGQPPGGPEAA